MEKCAKSVTYPDCAVLCGPAVSRTSWSSRLGAALALRVFCLAQVAVAERIAPPALAPSAYADTEASTNIAIAVQDASRSFSVSLSLDAGASNCVEVAVGHDAAPSDGFLTAAEASLLFGWDCGR